MHPRQTWLAIGLLTAFTVQAAVIYKWVDADGVVHYSDQSSPGAEKIVTAVPSARPRHRQPATPSTPGVPPQRPAQGGLNYVEFSITSPTPDQTFFGDDVVAVHLNSQPVAAAQSIHHLAFERQAAGPSAECRLVRSAAPGSRHVCACRHHHRPANQRIADQQQRDLLRAPALGAVAAVASQKIARSTARAEARLVG